MNESNEEQVNVDLGRLKAHMIKIALYAAVMVGPIIVLAFLQELLLYYMKTSYDEWTIGLVFGPLLVIWWGVMLKVVLPLLFRKVDSRVSVKR